jgi:sulfur carrier protein
VNVTVNGEPRELPDGATIHALLNDLKLTPDKVAVELNRRLVRSNKYNTALKAGDVIEVVTFVGGGA